MKKLAVILAVLALGTGTAFAQDKKAEAKKDEKKAEKMEKKAEAKKDEKKDAKK